MDNGTPFEGKIPCSQLNEWSTDNDITVQLTGFSGDALRTCIYYHIPDNNGDFQVQDAFLVDEEQHVYCLVSVERKCREQSVSWMEFGAVSPGVSHMELHITSLQQAPTTGSFKLRGRSFVDPWDPEIQLTNEMVEKLDSWIGGIRHKSGETSEWEKPGSWRFSIPTGIWKNEEFDIIKPIDSIIDFGRELVRFREFRNSNTGAFIVVEAFDSPTRGLGEKYKKTIMDIFRAASTPEEFDRILEDAGITRGYNPVKLNMRLLDKDKDTLFSPDYVESWGMLKNRRYHFFDHCICGKNLEILVKEVQDLKLTAPIEIPLDPSLVLFEEPIKIDCNAGTIKVEGEIYLDEVVFLEEGVKITYRLNLSEPLTSFTFNDAQLRVRNNEGKEELYPALGGQIRLDSSGEKLEKIILFPTSAMLESNFPENLSLLVNSVDVKLKNPLRLEFAADYSAPVYENQS